MKLSKSLLAVVGATALLGAAVSSASAGRLSSSSQTIRATWTRMDFSGGFGRIECEVTVEGSLHARSIVKTVNGLIGFFTAVSVRNPCIRGGATVLRETLPWHVTFRSFTEALPNIGSIATNVIGASFALREPSFGASCLARTTASSPGILSWIRDAFGSITSAIFSGSTTCIGMLNVTAAVSGTSNTIHNGAGAAIALTLI